MIVLILTIVGGFFSITAGGCASSTLDSAAQIGESIGDFQRDLGDHYQATKTRREAAELRKSGSNYVMLGLLEAVLCIAGGIYVYRKCQASAALDKARVRYLMVASGAILLAAALSLTNTFALISAGALNTIAGILAIMQVRSLGSTT